MAFLHLYHNRHINSRPWVLILHRAPNFLTKRHSIARIACILTYRRHFAPQLQSVLSRIAFLFLTSNCSAFGSRILVVDNGRVSVSAGTSASTPIVAGILALVNDARLRLNKPPLGFFNPALYDMIANCPTCFNGIRCVVVCDCALLLLDDCGSSCVALLHSNSCGAISVVATGNNKCSNMRCCRWGYEVSKASVNAVTGAGTPNVAEWIKWLTK